MSLVVIGEIFPHWQLSTLQLSTSEASSNMRKASMKASITGIGNNPDQSVVEASRTISCRTAMLGTAFRAWNSGNFNRRNHSTKRTVLTKFFWTTQSDA